MQRCFVILKGESSFVIWVVVMGLISMDSGYLLMPSLANLFNSLLDKNW